MFLFQFLSVLIGFTVTNTVGINNTFLTAVANASEQQVNSNEAVNSNNTVLYDVICMSIEVAPTFALRNCKLIVVSGHLEPPKTVLVSEIANVRLESPVNVNDQGIVQNNPFATVHNFPGTANRNSTAGQKV